MAPQGFLISACPGAAGWVTLLARHWEAAMGCAHPELSRVCRSRTTEHRVCSLPVCLLWVLVCQRREPSLLLPFHKEGVTRKARTEFVITSFGRHWYRRAEGMGGPGTASHEEAFISNLLDFRASSNGGCGGRAAASPREQSSASLQEHPVLCKPW